MTKTTPTLALDLSSDAARLQQLAFDGHWHEMARAGFNEIGLAEKMAFMRRVAVRLEGRSFRNVVWLPDEQIVTRTLQLPEGDPALREAAARSALATITKQPADDFVVRLGADDEDGFTHVVGLRQTTMQEARRFATSHGFRADAFTANQDFAGFGGPVFFQPPPDRQKQRKLAAIAAGAILLASASLGGLWVADPLGWRAEPALVAAAPVVVETAPIPDAVPEAPPIETATSDPVDIPVPPVDQVDIVALDPEISDQSPVLSAPSQPLDAVSNAITTPVEQATPDTQTAELLQTAPSQELPPIADLTDPATVDIADAEPVDTVVEVPEPETAPIAEEVTSAEIDPAPDLPARWSELASQLPPAEAALPPAETPVEEPVVAQEPAVTVTPEPIRPDPFAIVAGMPDFAPLLRNGTALPEAQAVPVVAETVAPEADVEVILGRPEFEPLLRGPATETDAAPVETVAQIDPDEVTADPAPAAETQTPDDAALIAARALRPARRPESFAEEAVQSTDILSGAAPRTAVRAVHRTANFTEQIAPLLASSSAAPATSAPALPPEPRTVSLPSSASVQRAATIENALNMREVALIGIYGTADDRRALIRLASGRYIRLTLGETFSGGWRIIAMDETSVRVQKGNRTEILRVIQ